MELTATYDPVAKALYIQFGPELAEGEHVDTVARDEGWQVDYHQGKVYGYEFLLTEPLETLGP